MENAFFNEARYDVKMLKNLNSSIEQRQNGISSTSSNLSAEIMDPKKTIETNLENVIDICSIPTSAVNQKF